MTTPSSLTTCHQSASKPSQVHYHFNRREIVEKMSQPARKAMSTLDTYKPVRPLPSIKTTLEPEPTTNTQSFDLTRTVQANPAWQRNRMHSQLSTLTVDKGRNSHAQTVDRQRTRSVLDSHKAAELPLKPVLIEGSIAKNESFYNLTERF